MADRYVRLKYQDGTFHDPHSDFFLSKNEVKLLPEPHSPVISQWLNAGGLVFCDPPAGRKGETAVEAIEEEVKDEGIEEAPLEDSKEETDDKDNAGIPPVEAKAVKRSPGRPKGGGKGK